jgi:pimeloyl-ACP methyl ester carboxylesterase
VPAVFVHGNPESAAIWAPLLSELARADVVRLSPPGFGASVPDGFGATADEYLAWLVAELEVIGEPVDLVGHDWGANHTFRLACERPDLVRSWCIDTAGVFDPGYIWHEGTRAWRTPGEGEAAVAAMIAMGAAARAEVYRSMAVTTEAAEQMADAFDETMGRCILALYRSVGQDVLARWSERVPAASARPGLVLVPTDDVYTGGEARHRAVAERTGAEVVVLEGLGHWWLVQDPTAAARALERFWSRP